MQEDTIELRSGQRVTLRPARWADGQRLSSFRAALHQQALHLNAVPSELQQNWFPKGERGLHLLALSQRQIVGELRLLGTHHQRLRHDARLAIGLLEAVQGKGLGHAMVQRGLAWARAQKGIQRVSLAVHGGNTPALALYRRCGFVEEGRRKAAIGPRNPGEDFSDEILMAHYFSE